MSSFSGIHLALQALLTQQHGLEVTSHNVANSGTEGYHRQEAIFRAGPPQGAPGLASATFAGQVGTGVFVDNVKRYSSELTDMRYRRELADTRQYEVQSEYLLQVEGAMAETGEDGLSAILDSFWNGWSYVSTHPDDTTRRTNLLEDAKNLTRGLSGRVERLNDLRRDQNMAIIQRVDEINEIAAQVARLNIEIGRFSGPNTSPNDFLDEQDLYLDRLSEIAGVKVSHENTGQVMVSIGGHVLVHGPTAHVINYSPEPTNFNLVDMEWEDGQPLFLQSGELAGLIEGRDVVVNEQIESLNNLATTLITEVNALHQQGFGLNDTATYDPTLPPPNDIIGPQREFFTTTPPIFDPLNPALSITVNSELDDVNNIALSQTVVLPDPLPGVLTPGLPIAPGDASIADEIFRIKDNALTFGSPPNTVTDTISHYNNMRVTNLALDVNRAETLSNQHDNLLQVLKEKRESVSGVNLDEEAAHMLQYERSYQAAVRLMTTVDEMLDRIINNMGLVGR
ncbi:MAG: flagellar hook-associated protein FlgK [Anaerolineaceae bacterium]|nr:flagellar hook-associated protein FlgK [Anaerolineaceae bacterium]